MRLKRTPFFGCTGAWPLSVWGASCPSARGRVIVIAMVPASDVQRGDVDEAALLPRLQRGLDQLHALGTFGQRPLVRRVLDHVADEVLPLDLEAVVVDLRVR